MILRARYMPVNLWRVIIILFGFLPQKTDANPGVLRPIGHSYYLFFCDLKLTVKKIAPHNYAKSRKYKKKLKLASMLLEGVYYFFEEWRIK